MPKENKSILPTFQGSYTSPGVLRTPSQRSAVGELLLGPIDNLSDQEVIAKAAQLFSELPLNNVNEIKINGIVVRKDEVGQYQIIRPATRS